VGARTVRHRSEADTCAGSREYWVAIWAAETQRDVVTLKAAGTGTKAGVPSDSGAKPKLAAWGRRRKEGEGTGGRGRGGEGAREGNEVQRRIL